MEAIVQDGHAEGFSYAFPAHALSNQTSGPDEWLLGVPAGIKRSAVALDAKFPLGEMTALHE